MPSDLPKRITVQQEKLCKRDKKKVVGILSSLINSASRVGGDQRLFHIRGNISVRPLRKGREFLGTEDLGFPG